MKNRKTPTEIEVADWLKQGRLDLPPIRFRLTRIQPQYERNRRWDFEIQGKWAAETAKFAVEYKALYTPQAFENALLQCVSNPLPTGRFPMILLPYLQSSQLDQLEKAGISGIDLCGNGIVVVPKSIRVYRTGAPNQFSISAPIKNIYRKNTSMVPRLFAAVPAFASVQAVCNEVNARNPFVRNESRTPIRLGTVSKALQRLEDDLIITRKGTIQILQPEKLLSKLSGNYETPRSTQTRRIRVQKTPDELRNWLRNKSKDIPYPVVATGISSVGRYAVMAREETIALYCPRLDDLQDRLQGTETDRFPNVELIETDDEPVYFDARVDRGFAWASPLQTYLELTAGDKRDQETADQVKSLMLRTMKVVAK